MRESDSPCDTVMTLCLKDFGSASGAWPTLSLRECQESFQAANSHSSDPEASDAESMRLPGASIFTQLASQEQCLIGKPYEFFSFVATSVRRRCGVEERRRL